MLFTALSASAAHIHVTGRRAAVCGLVACALTPDSDARPLSCMRPRILPDLTWSLVDDAEDFLMCHVSSARALSVSLPLARPSRFAGHIGGVLRQPHDSATPLSTRLVCGPRVLSEQNGERALPATPLL